jgi:type II secretory pathway predicted ATPase ExeA/Tfp pilus assembly PilM family ATPase|tara:strand:+ start:470 stop:3250 length:2781 start_codon:yes stop_codon:yes gene_type:complete
MRRGLSVVQGGVGVGKTTVSRMLIQLFSDESDVYDFYLILNPKFETELLLLQHLIELFGIQENGKTVQDCRDIIENHLLKVGVDEGKILVLIVDEGQNLDGKYLDVFRTLLNFETDDYKLLQLIIFGQPEMENFIQEYPNFVDRISFHYKIGPLDLDQMRGFIHHRLKMTGAGDHNWFPDEIIEMIYQNTKGYPRKVTQICHQLLLHMIGDKKDQVDIEIFNNVVDGKLPSGLLDLNKRNTNTTSTNKLLNVLRKNKPKVQSSEPIKIKAEDEELIGSASSIKPEENDDDDTIGDTPTDKPIASQPETVPDPEGTKEITDPKNLTSPAVEPSSITPSDDTLEFNAMSGPLTDPGKFPKGIEVPLLIREAVIIGIAIDENKIVAVAIQDHRNTKRLIDVQIYEHSEDIDLALNPAEAMIALKSIIELSAKSALNKNFLTKKVIESISNGTAIALSINSPLMSLKRVDIPKESQGDRKKIIEWNAKKLLYFDPIYLQYDAVNQRKSKEVMLVGTTNRQLLEQTGEIIANENWSIRWWHPITMAIHNAFIWNYPEESKEVCFLIHIGEKESFLFGYAHGLLQVVRPIAIGIQNLTDAVLDSSTPLSQYRVPPSLLPGKAKPGSSLPTDDQFRPVIENWTREIDRTITSLKRIFPAGEASKLYLSGSATYIQSLHEYFGGQLNLATEYLNPLRNIYILPDENERGQLNVALPLITAAVGSALNLANTVNLLPSSLKQNESFRLLFKSTTRVAAALLIGLFTFTGWVSVQNEKLDLKLKTLKKESALLEPTRDLYYSIDKNKSAVKAQVDELSTDTEYFERILASLRFLSHQTPSEITFEEVRFQMGWEESQFYAYGQTRKAELKVLDPHLRILKIAGTVSANSAYKERIFQIYLDSLEESSLFNEIEVISKHTSIGLDVQEMTFVLKCIL